MTPVNGVGLSECLYWAVSASPLAAQCHVMGPSLSPLRLGDPVGDCGGPRARPGPFRVTQAAIPGVRTASGAEPIEEKRPETQGGRTPWVLRLAFMRALLRSAARAYFQLNGTTVISARCSADCMAACNLGFTWGPTRH